MLPLIAPVSGLLHLGSKQIATIKHFRLEDRPTLPTPPTAPPTKKAWWASEEGLVAALCLAFGFDFLSFSAALWGVFSRE